MDRSQNQRLETGTITRAMLELGIERHFERFDEKSTADFIQILRRRSGSLRKILQRRLSTLR